MSKAVCDDGWTDSDEDDWTEEDKKLYSQQLDDSENFDVQLPVRNSTYFGLIGPMNIHDKNFDFYSIAQAAIKAYNQSEERKSGELQFEKVLKCMGQVCAFMNYYMTFEAKDLSSGEVGTYQAYIYEDIKGTMEVLSFRRKPTDDEVAANLPKEWVWRHDL